MQSCTTCIHRPYGDQRRYTDCMVIEPFWSKHKPHPKSFGAKCKRYEPDASRNPTQNPGAGA